MLLPTGFNAVVVPALMLLALVFRPQGLLGRKLIRA